MIGRMDNSADGALTALGHTRDLELVALALSVRVRYEWLARYFLAQAQRLGEVTRVSDDGERLIEELRHALRVLEPWARP